MALTRRLGTIVACLVFVITLAVQLALGAKTSPPPAAGVPNPEGELFESPTAPWANSTGYLTLPAARALASRPRWTSAGTSDYRSSPGDQIYLAIVGLPIDLDHFMFGDVSIETYCVSRQSASEQSSSLCNRSAADYTLINSSKEFTPCYVSDDCWHSTAAALLALGRPDPSSFSIRSVMASPFRDRTSTFDSVNPRYKKSEVENKPDDEIIFPLFPEIYTSLNDIQYVGLNASSAECDGEKRSLTGCRVWRRLRAEYKMIPAAAYPLVELYRRESDSGGGGPRRSLINANMLLSSGASRARLLAVNVFSRVDSAQTCAATGRKAPCVLTNVAAQDRALEIILARATKEIETRGKTSVGAVLIVAGGPLVKAGCDNTPTARLITKLREVGVATFVPAGNDGSAQQVRFPACASDAIAVGSLRRDGKVAAYSNGWKSPFIKMYRGGPGNLSGYDEWSFCLTAARMVAEQERR